MTAEWEQKLLDMEKGNFRNTEFMDEIEEMITNLVKTYKVIENAEVLMHPALEKIGICPCCGKSVIEKSKGFFCENNSCQFVLWKDNRFFNSLSKKITRAVAEQLLSKGSIKLKKCRSVKTGKTYDCTVTMDVNENGNGKPRFGISFEKRSG